MIDISRLFARSRPVLSPAGTHDAAAIAGLHADAFHRGWSEQEFERLLIDRAVVAHRATADRDLAGFVLSRMAAGEAEILSIAVARRWRRQGVARRLLDMHLQTLMQLGVGTLFLEVDEGNVAARALYRRAGFREAGRREGYYPASSGAPVAALVLRRDLP